MTLPLSGPISLSEIYTEFGAPARTLLTELNRGGDYVPDEQGTNSSIPEDPPMAFTDYYGGEGNPEYFLKENFIVPMGTVVVLSAQPQGLFMEAQDPGEASPTAGSEFWVNMKVRCGPGQVDGVDQGPFVDTPTGLYNEAYARMQFYLGLTTADPSIYSPATLIQNLVGGTWVTYYQTSRDNNGIAFLDTVGSPDQDSFDDYTTTGQDFADLIPTESQYTLYKTWRGFEVEAIGSENSAVLSQNAKQVNNSFNWGDRDNFGQTVGGNLTPWNTAGWLVLVCGFPPGGGSCDLDVEFIEVRVRDALPLTP